jgi:hypothetical protein
MVADYLALCKNPARNFQAWFDAADAPAPPSYIKLYDLEACCPAKPKQQETGGFYDDFLGSTERLRARKMHELQEGMDPIKGRRPLDDDLPDRPPARAPEFDFLQPVRRERGLEFIDAARAPMGRSFAAALVAGFLALCKNPAKDWRAWHADAASPAPPDFYDFHLWPPAADAAPPAPRVSVDAAAATRARRSVLQKFRHAARVVFRRLRRATRKTFPRRRAPQRPHPR